MLRPREATLTFPAPGTSLGTLEHLGVTFADGALLDDAVDDSARAARAACGAHAAGGAGDLTTACAAAVTAYRNGYAGHWIWALAADVHTSLAADHMATPPRLAAP